MVTRNAVVHQGLAGSGFVMLWGEADKNNNNNPRVPELGVQQHVNTIIETPTRNYQEN